MIFFFCAIFFVYLTTSHTSSTTAVQMWIISYIFHITSLHGKYELNKLTSLPMSPMCGFIAQLIEHRTGIQASSFQLFKLENLLQWLPFTFIYNRSTNMNYFIYFTILFLVFKPACVVDVLLFTQVLGQFLNIIASAYIACRLFFLVGSYYIWSTLLYETRNSRCISVLYCWKCRTESCPLLMWNFI